jgi:L-galactose dehydrogenase
VRAALDAGINYFDTAPYYMRTRAESVLGHALRGVPRDSYILATKVGRYDHDGFDFSAERMARSVDESLGRLGGTHVDVIQVHDLEFGSLDQVCQETLPALARLRAQGKVRHIGITGLPLAALRRVIRDAGPLVDTVLSYCHGTIADQTFLPFAEELRLSGRGVLNAAPLSMGLLTRKGPPAWHPAPLPLREACAAAAKLCEAQGVDFAELATIYALGLPGIDCTIIGISSAEEARRAAGCVGKSIRPQLLRDIETILAPVQGMTWSSGRPENNLA